MTATYILSISKKTAAVYTGKMHPMSVRAAAKRFSDDAFVVEYCGAGHIASDVLKLRSHGAVSLSLTERELIAGAQ